MNSPFCRPAARAASILVMALFVAAFGRPAWAGGGGAAGDDDPTRYIAFVEEFVSTCVQRNGVQVLIRSTHPSRTLRVWLDRFHMGVGTGDRSRSDLAPAGEPQALGCSRSTTGVQEWRVVRAVWVD